MPEVRKLLLQVVWDCVASERDVFAWSEWRRHHQYWARFYHYQRRHASPPKDDLQL